MCVDIRSEINVNNTRSDAKNVMWCRLQVREVRANVDAEMT